MDDKKPECFGMYDSLTPTTAEVRESLLRKMSGNIKCPVCEEGPLYIGGEYDTPHLFCNCGFVSEKLFHYNLGFTTAQAQDAEKMAKLEEKVKEEHEWGVYWNKTANKLQESSDYYQAELEKAHAILGRVIHQLSERWDTVNLTKYFPTSNLWRKKTIDNPSGEGKND